MKKIFSLILGSALIVSCNSDLDSFNEVPVRDDSRMVELGENFVLAGVGEGGSTRTHWTVEESWGVKSLANMFLPNWGDGTGTTLDKTTDPESLALGLCWVGDNGVSDIVYTNYKFTHVGWLKQGVEKADLGTCDDGQLYNGYLYSQVDATKGTQGDEVTISSMTQLTEVDGTTISLSSTNAADKYINFNSGVYKTGNKSIFGGEYVVYYPYDSNFTDKDAIPVKAQMVFEDTEDINDKALGESTFRYGHIKNIAGGVKAEGFSLKNLSGLVQIQLTQNGAFNAGDVKKIVLYSPSAGFVSEAKVSAEKIANEASDVIVPGSKVGAKTIIVNPDAMGSYTPSVPSDATKTYFYISALPTKLTDLQVLVQATIDGKDKWAIYNINNFEIKAGKIVALSLPAPIAPNHFSDVKFAVDEQTLYDAQPAGSLYNEIIVLNPIVLDEVIPLVSTIEAVSVISGDTIIVPETRELTVEGTLNNGLKILGTECCTKAANEGGKVVVNNQGKISGVRMVASQRYVRDNKPAFLKDMTITDILAEKTNEPILTFTTDYDTNPQPIQEGNIVDAEGGRICIPSTIHLDLYDVDFFLMDNVYMPIEGELNLRYAPTAVADGEGILNVGVIELASKAIFDLWTGTAPQWQATAAEGALFTNCGLFIQNINSNPGTAVQNQTLSTYEGHENKGIYRCRAVDQSTLDYAILNYKGCTEIELIDKADYNFKNFTAANKHRNDWIDVLVSTLADGSTLTDEVKEIHPEIGNLVVEKKFANKFTIDYSARSTASTNDKQLLSSLTIHRDLTAKSEVEVTEIRGLKVDGNVNVINVEDYIALGNNGLTVASTEAYTFEVGKSVVAEADVDLLNISVVTAGTVGTPTTKATVGENVIMKAGKLSYANTVKSLAVTGDITLNTTSSMEVAANAGNITATNFWMKKGSHAKFNMRSISTLKTMAIAQTIEVPSGAVWEYDYSGSDQPYVTCTQVLGGGKFLNGSPSTF